MAKTVDITLPLDPPRYFVRDPRTGRYWLFAESQLGGLTFTRDHSRLMIHAPFRGPDYVAYYEEYLTCSPDDFERIRHFLPPERLDFDL